MTEPSIEKVRDALKSACVITVNEHAFAVLFKGELQHVVGLNRSAEILVRLVLGGKLQDDVTRNYAAALGIPDTVAAEFISIIAKDWTRIGVIGPDSWSRADSNPSAPPVPPAPDKAEFDAIVSMGGKPVRLILYDAKLTEITARMVEGSQTSPAPPDPYTIHAWRDGDIWAVTDSDGAAEAIERIEVARDRTLAKIMANSWPELADAPCIHGATLRGPGGKHVMLSGDSGRGKTTLALGLGKRSFTLLADDMSVFDAATGRVLPIKSNPSVKEGSWQALGGLYPELPAQKPVMVNGRLCKYVRRAGPMERENPHGIDALIFPNWQPGAEAKLAPYDSQASLLSMLRWSYLPQNQENLQAMADFLSSLPLYELTYSSFEQADRMLLDLLECQS